jgi:hypothetical protein
MVKKTYIGIKNEVRIFDGQGGTINLPMFMIFISPSELVQFAEVPSFKESDTHKEIAANLKNPPTRDWQRPIDIDRISAIGNYFGTTTEKRMMPNPILLGESSTSSNQSDSRASITVKQKIDSAGQAIRDVWDIEMLHNGNFPLWILDGQHRTYGLADNQNTKDEKIPVVLLIKSSQYTMSFLAQIFTEVTTGAKDLEDIHKNWMLYSFGMFPFKKGLGSGIKNSCDLAMECVLHLVTLSDLDGQNNAFFDNIKFNPYDKSVRNTYNYTWTSKEWVDVLSQNYFNNSGSLAPLELAETIIRFLRAASSLDIHSTADSKLFGKNDNPGILHNNLMWQFLQNLDYLNLQSEKEWRSHLLKHGWDRADWRLAWASGSQSSFWGLYSNRAAEFVFKRVMSHVPFSVTPDVALRGPAELTITAYPKTANGKKSKINMASALAPSGAININGGAGTWTLGANRALLEFSTPPNGIGSIYSVEFKDSRGQSGKLIITKKATSTQVLDLNNYSSPIDIDVWTCCFNESSKRKETITIQW